MPHAKLALFGTFASYARGLCCALACPRLIVALNLTSGGSIASCDAPAIALASLARKSAGDAEINMPAWGSPHACPAIYCRCSPTQWAQRGTLLHIVLVVDMLEGFQKASQTQILRADGIFHEMLGQWVLIRRQFGFALSLQASGDGLGDGAGWSASANQVSDKTDSPEITQTNVIPHT
ncbi:hypothetical protein HETIRDRAFT_452993 [Heterobasidion irregulare TC 32-1]|uniref:Uncharacterized protein n=1 Tax=Heterobasidion irregulare (strain TC 32-1) TaxID=747525 RepID=W4K3Q8_HETIT|nr:uncharacterized protein HETIRDRAFT_452993 [Heterobasidion irregulare TC 32-1]ETW79975.1 hypothetical protein HETIRDRAFT_452993 [Heterobasidion irregulare TC 32-1]